MAAAQVVGIAVAVILGGKNHIGRITQPAARVVGPAGGIVILKNIWNDLYVYARMDLTEPGGAECAGNRLLWLLADQSHQRLNLHLRGFDEMVMAAMGRIKLADDQATLSH